MTPPTDADVRKAGEVRMAWQAQGGPRLPRVLTIQQESELDMAIAQAFADQREQGVRIADALRARRDALMEAVEIALRCGGLTAHYEHMTWPAVRAALAAGKGEE